MSFQIISNHANEDTTKFFLGGAFTLGGGYLAMEGIRRLALNVVGVHPVFAFGLVPTAIVVEKVVRQIFPDSPDLTPGWITFRRLLVSSVSVLITASLVGWGATLVGMAASAAKTAIAASIFTTGIAVVAEGIRACIEAFDPSVEKGTRAHPDESIHRAEHRSERDHLGATAATMNDEQERIEREHKTDS